MKAALAPLPGVGQQLGFLGLLHMEHPSCRNLPFSPTAGPRSLHTNLHPLMSVCTSPLPSLNPSSFLLCFPTSSSYLPRLSQNSSSAPLFGVCRLRRTHLRGPGRMGDLERQLWSADAALPCRRRAGPRAGASRWTLFEPLHRWLG